MQNNKKVVWFFGVNGVGKTSLISEIMNRSDPSKVEAIYNVLLSVAGVKSRQDLERMEAIKKYELLEKSLLEKVSMSSAEIILVDCHLMVSIRSDNYLRYECMWSNKFIAISKIAFLLTADIEEILSRRKIDEKFTGRKRDLNVHNINKDQKINSIMFDSMVHPIIPAVVLETSDRSVEKIASDIEGFIHSEKIPTTDFSMYS